MPPMPTDERRKLEAGVIAAREAAEDAARAALNVLGVTERERPSWLGEEELRLRRALRARARQLGGDDGLEGGMPLLVEEVAYEAWHRMLFARFLAENGLLRHPTGTTVSLQDCADLAEAENARDTWDLAARYASAMLPGLFRADDPTVQVRFAPEGTSRLEAILEGLPVSTFSCDDGLGWMYQFWQTRKKEEVNNSGRKIGGADLSPVTQLFTEDYMVRFLLEKSLGAWWAARHPESPLLREWDYLRRNADGSPAAGDFAGWPTHAADVTVMDPCCGSGHFLVAAFDMLRKMRMEEENLSSSDAADAVLRENLFGLELDLRCTQIAIFAVAMSAWRASGHPETNPPQIACSGIPVKGSLDDWRKLVEGDNTLKSALEELYALFREAPTLGSLIDPRRIVEEAGLFRLDWVQVERQVAAKLGTEENTTVFMRAAVNAAEAATLLGGKYTLVATNVPFLKRGSQAEILKSFCSARHDYAKADLATVMFDRCLSFCAEAGSVALVLPQPWLFLKTYSRLRQRVLEETTLMAIALLGEEAWQSYGIRGPRTILLIAQNSPVALGHRTWGIDASTPPGKTVISIGEKIALLRSGPISWVGQCEQRANPDGRISLLPVERSPLLERFANGIAGIQSGDYARFGRFFWELPSLTDPWAFQQSTVEATIPYGGREHVLFWAGGQSLRNLPGAYIRGAAAWRRQGIAVSQMRDLPVTLYSGELFDNNTAVILPKDPSHLPAIWAFCSSPEFSAAVRKLDQATKVTNATLVKVPFDLHRWQQAAEQLGPLSDQSSDDPTQWIFAGRPSDSESPIHVAVGRLVGYHWPEQREDDGLDDLADKDGILCLPPVAGEQPAAERLRTMLAKAFESDWSPAMLDRLLTEIGSSGKDLSSWLRDDFGAQHCRLFHNRPFIWQIWDGNRDGFAALVNYHRLDRRLLEKLTYTYLGAWIAMQKSDAASGRAGADRKLADGQTLKRKLTAILEGESPHDIYVRWKALREQPIGWDPDLNDGVRLNIRPFVTAGVLRGKFTINWNKDRGNNPAGSDVYRWSEEAQRTAGIPIPKLDGKLRLNDLHLSLAAKREARERGSS